MHAMLGELDMRRMSGLKRVLPRTRLLMLVGCAALAGVPFLAGFFSKDEIIGAAWAANKYLGASLLLTALITAYYTFRLYFRVFEGPEVLPPEPLDRSAGIHYDDHAVASAAAVQTGDTAHSGVDEHLQTGAHQAATTDHGHANHHHNHEPAIMILPLVVLAIGAVLAGYLNFPRPGLGEFLGHSPSFVRTYEIAQARAARHGGHAVAPEPLGQPEAAPHATASAEAAPEGHANHTVLMAVSGLIALAGIGLAYQFHLKDRRAGENLPRRFPALANALQNKFWVDELYQAAIVEPLRRAGKLFYAVDRIVVDGVVWAIGFVPQFSGFALKLTTQRGYLQGYAGAMAFGIVIILLVVFW
jgi:NADH:ubiquinone oxidoreductase subunit 5 (subunit L)/multisubunit Na+/H+ antiporter MnhA subunit